MSLETSAETCAPAEQNRGACPSAKAVPPSVLAPLRRLDRDVRVILTGALGILIGLLLVPGRAAEAPAATNAAARYEFRALHDPNGIGKFYCGREIAHVMGHQAADWLERPERETEENTALLIRSLKFRPGEVVADIGAGTGYHVRRIAPLIGSTGAVYAVEIQPEMLGLLTNATRRAGFTNVHPVLGSETDPKLPAAAVDTILMVDVYHEFDHPYEMTEAMCRALKPGGRLAFVEFRAEDPEVPIKAVHKMSEAQVKREMKLFPLDWSETLTNLPWQHVIIFKKRATPTAATSSP